MESLHENQETDSDRALIVEMLNELEALKKSGLMPSRTLSYEEKMCLDVMFSDIIASNGWKETKAVLPLLMGRDDKGNEVIEDLASIPHLMIGGAMGQDKAMVLHSFINGLILKRAPSQLQLLLVDFKDAEFDRYKSIPHLFSPIVSDAQDAVAQLRNVRKEMDKRYKSYLNVGVRNIREYNELQAASGKDQDPYVVVVIAEIADLMESSKKEFVSVVDGLSAMGRAAGIHLILATQKVKSISRGLTANIPGRIAFKVASSAESEIILGGSGAENLSDVDDMIFQNRNGERTHVKAAFLLPINPWLAGVRCEW